MNTINIHPLQQARKKLGIKQKVLAQLIGLSEPTIKRAESGKASSAYTIVTICEYFSQRYNREVKPEELGLHGQWEENVDTDNNYTPNADSVSYTNKEENTEIEPEENEEAMNRREATKEIAAFIGGSTLVNPQDLLKPQSWTKFSNILNDTSDIENLSQFKRLVDTSWHLLKASDLDVLERVLEAYLPHLEKLTKSSSSHHTDASSLTALAYEIKGILASHQLNLEKRAEYHQKAVNHSLQTKDYNIQMSALIQLASAFQYLKQPSKVLQTYKLALPMIDKGSPLLGSCVYLGLADASSQCNQEQEAITYLHKAREIFPENPEADPAYLFSDAGFFSLALYEGLTYLNIDKPKNAWNAFTQIEKYPKTSTPERVRVEIVNLQAETAIAEGDFDKFRDRIIEGRNGAVALGSEKRYQEALSAFRQAKLVWHGEARLKELNDLFVR